MRENLPTPAAGPSESAMARGAAQRGADGLHRRAALPATADTEPRTPLDELVRRNRAFESRVRELEAVNDALRREMQAQARRLQVTQRELALAARGSGDPPVAAGSRTVLAARTSDATAAMACGQHGEPGCALHGEQHCARCRGLAPAQRLSVREREVLRLLTEGSRSPCIAAQLGISIATVEVHRRNIMRKLGLHCVADLTRYAVRQGLTPL